MNEWRWQQIQEIFSQAADLPESEQQQAIEALCAGDESLKAEVLALLEEDRLPNKLLDSGFNEAARAILDSSPLPSLIQQQIGPYRVLELLGEGGMGVVYLAERTDIGGKVAIKLLRDAWLSPMRRQRFHIEQLTLAQLNHPNIARIYDSSTLEDGTPWFVMEYADGQPLTEYWQQHGTNIRDCLLLFRRICEAVQFAHSHAIIHRDLKPSNILVTSGGEVKLLDFGIAKQLNSDDPEENRTVTGLRLMTLAYAAPEQILGEPVGVYTDVYALGVLLYELITRSLPPPIYPTRNHEGKIQTGDVEIEKPSTVIRRDKSEIITQLSKPEWADLDVLLFKAVEQEAGRRYRTVDALMRDLDALLEGRTLEARPPHFIYTVSKFTQRNRKALIAVAAVLLLMGATVVFYTVRLAAARNAALQEAARTRRIQQFTESLFDGGDKAAGPASDLRAVDLLERGRHEAASLAGEPEMQADIQETLGGIYQKLGKLDLAEPLLQSALDERKRALGTDHRKVADSLVALGLLRKDQGKLDEAETLVQKGVEIRKANQRSLSTHDADTARSMVALGLVLETHGKYDQAKEVLEAALKLQPQTVQPTADRADNLAELANIDFYQGHYDQSESLNNQALVTYKQLFGEQHPSVAQIFNNLGAIAMNRGKYPTAELYYRQSLAITESWYGTDHPETAANLTALAQPLTMEKRFDEAESLLQRALAIQKKVNGPINSTVATTLNQLGLLAHGRNQYDVARPYFAEAKETWGKLYGDQHPFIAIAYSNIGSVCLDEKDYACAEKNFREAVHRLDAATAQSLQAAIAHLKLGRALLREGKFEEARPQTLAGYQYLVKQVSASNGFLVASRKDLAAIYDGLHDASTASRYRAELSLVVASKTP